MGELVIKTIIVNKHVHICLSKAHFYILSRLRLGAWKSKVNNINLEHINRSSRFCNYCSTVLLLILL